MRNKNKKRTFFIYLPYECTAVEEYLEQMAEKGWLLESIKGAFLKFKKIEPQRIKYSVDILSNVSIFDHKDSDVALEYREYCQAAGWTYVCQAGKIQIFYTKDDKKTISIHTDEEEKFKSVFKASLSNVAMQLFLIFMFMFNLYMQLFLGSTDFALASNLGIASIVAMFSAATISGIRIISFIIWIIKARSKLKENRFMPYNNYKQLRIKNILTKAYTLIMLLTLFSLIVLDKDNSAAFTISLLGMICIPTIVAICAQRFINKKRYSKNTNMAITISSTLVSIYIVLMFTGIVVIWSINGVRENKVPKEKASLTLSDFGYKENNNESPYITFDRSIVAQRIYYSHGNGNEFLNYTIFQSQYPWVSKFYEKRLLVRHRRYGDDLKQENTKLPRTIKVYSDSEKRFFIIISENKVVDIRKDFKNISDEEFLNKAYEKFFK